MMLKLQYHTWDDRKVSVDLKPGRYRVGRNDDNDIVIDELAVSGEHCLLTVDAGGVMRIQDVGTVSGVFVEGAPVDTCVVAPGQMIHLGTFMIKVLAEDTSESSSPAPHLESVPLSDGSYSCLNHQDQRAVYECEHCFHLFCHACLASGLDSQHAPPVCPACGKEAKAIDWSGLHLTKRDAAMQMLPDSVKTALNYWEKLKQFRDGKSVNKGDDIRETSR